MGTYQELKQMVDGQDGVSSVNMETLRDLHGAAKLGIHVRDNISKALAGNGLGHFPNPLPDRQHDLVRVYTLGSKVGDLINAALNVGSANDTTLRKATPNGDGKILDKIRELLL